MKKKSHINALKIAAAKTGKISNNIAVRETVSNRTKATVRYPRKPEKPKHIAETKITPVML